MCEPKTTKQFHVKQRVKAVPVLWMRDDAEGVVAKVGRKFIHVKMLASRRILQFHPDNLLPA